MSGPIQQQRDFDHELRAFARRERKLQRKWESFKKKLRGNKSLDPDCATEKFGAELAKYETAMKLIDEAREQINAKAVPD